MASSGRIRRACCWWCLLLCFLPKVEAATRKNVTLPSLESQAEQATSSSVVGGALEVIAPVVEQEYIPAATKNVPVRGILGGTTYGLNTIAGEAKGLLKGNLATLLIGAGLQALLDGVGWVMKDGTLSKPITGTDSNLVYKSSSTPLSFGETTRCAFGTSNGPGIYATTGGFYVMWSTTPYQTSPWQYIQNCDPIFASMSPSYTPSKVATTPLTDSDYDAIDTFLPTQNADFIKNVLMDSCKNAPSAGVSVSSCYQAMKKESLKLTGPLSVPGATEVTSGTYAKPDGTTGTSTTTTSTNYTITYGDSYYDYTTNKNVVSTVDGVKTTDQTTSDGTDPTDEQPDDDKTSPSPCASNCDGPVYTDLYTPTTDTKETFLGRYKDKVGSIPVLSAASGFFTVSASAGCPVWQVHTDMAIMQADLPINLVFDFHCQPWFVSAVSFASVVMSIVCAYYAFRIAFLD